MERNDEPKPMPRRREGETSADAAPFTIIGASAKRLPQQQDSTPRRSKRTAAAEEKPVRRAAFRELPLRRVSDQSPNAAFEAAADRPMTADDERELAKLRRGRILRLWPRLLRRGIYRFHARFSVVQILAFYIGIPILLSVVACVYVLTLPGPQTESAASSPPPASSETMLRRVVKALRDEDNTAAARAVEQLEATYPNEAQTHMARGALMSTLGKTDEARAAMQRAVELAPTSPPARMNLAELEFSVGQYEQAIEHYRKLPANTVHSPLIAFRLYISYELTGRHEEAQALLRSEWILAQSAEDLFIRAAQASRRGDEATARSLVSSAEVLFGEKAEAYEAALKKIGWLK